MRFFAQRLVDQWRIAPTGVVNGVKLKYVAHTMPLLCHGRDAHAETMPARDRRLRATYSGVMGPNKNRGGTRDNESLCPAPLFAIVSAMGFHELIQQGREPGENGLPSDYFDSLASEYDQFAQTQEQRMRELTEGFSAKENEYKTQLSERDSELARLKTQNYDLLMSSAGDSEGSDKQEPEDNGPLGVASLFE